MSNLIPTQNQIAKSMISKLQQRISPLRTSGKTALLLDISGSMRHNTDGNMKRIDALLLGLKSFETEKVRRFAFNSDFKEVTIIDPLYPEGGTNLAGALEKLSTFGFQNIILFTDGEPDSKEAALTAAKNLNASINVIFVGNPHDRSAITFCEDLAKQFNGQFAANPLEAKTIGFLTATVQLMLGDGNNTIAL